MFFSSHTLSEIEQLASRIAVLDSGRFLACDTLAALKLRTGASTLEGVFLSLTGHGPELIHGEPPE